MKILPLSQFGEVAEIDWTRERQLALLRTPMRRWLGWGVAKSLVPLWSMSGANYIACGGR